MESVLGARLTDERAMAVALEVARRGLGKVSPNPMVGAVLLSPAGLCLATGYHAQVGGAHAEADLLDKITDQNLLKGARLFVTLEPCSHVGRTPSCARRLATLPLAEVVYGLADPSEAAGGGAQILRDAGIKATRYRGELEADMAELCEVFTYTAQSKTAFVALKAGVTLDGKLAHRGGASQWITGEASRLEAHKLRALYDAVLVGERTLYLDNPSLNIRHPEFGGLEKKVIVLAASEARAGFLKSSNLLKNHTPENILWVTAPGGAPPQTDLQHLEVPFDPEGGLDLSELKLQLTKAGIFSVLVEGGAFTLSKFLTAGVAQRLHLFVAPKVLGASGVGWSDGLEDKDMSTLLQLKGGKWRVLDDDVYYSGRF